MTAKRRKETDPDAKPMSLPYPQGQQRVGTVLCDGLGSNHRLRQRQASRMLSTMKFRFTICDLRFVLAVIAVLISGCATQKAPKDPYPSATPKAVVEVTGKI